MGKGVIVDLFDAIYTRQSVDKMDSISVESQVEFCKREVFGNEIKIYTDKGYSGKNIDRPAFQELLEDVRAGYVRRVIVYRLDRISRSVLDFANVIDTFQKYRVEFVSTMEKFDTGTPIGKAMLMIVMIFAQLERETIQQRVLDAYASRSRRGFYMGGRVPYGFQLKDTIIDGIHTKMYEPIEEEIRNVKIMFSLYADPQVSFGDVARYLFEHGMLNRGDIPFSRTRIRDIIVNPIYVKADYEIYEFFKSNGVTITNIPNDFIGINGAYLYAGAPDTNRKTISLQGHVLVLAPHKGVVSSDIWMKCRKKCMNNKAVAKPIKAKATWLAGKIKCGYCGYALSAKTSPCKTKENNRYFICTHKYTTPGACNFGSIDADEVEKIIYEGMLERLQNFKVLSDSKEDTFDKRIPEWQLRIEEIEKEISMLVETLLVSNEVTVKYINEKIESLDSEKKHLQNNILQIESDNKKKQNDVGEIKDYIDMWSDLSIKDKITVVDCFVEKIIATEKTLEIKWKI